MRYWLEHFFSTISLIRYGLEHFFGVDNFFDALAKLFLCLIVMHAYCVLNSAIF